MRSFTIEESNSQIKPPWVDGVCILQSFSTDIALETNVYSDSYRVTDLCHWIMLSLYQMPLLYQIVMEVI